MPLYEKVKHILAELKGHSPFTLFGALLGIVFMLIFSGLDASNTHALFQIFHPAHVVLSAMVTASMFKIHTVKKRLVLMLVVGYLGSIGIATLSDIVIPHIGSHLLGLNVPTHAELHQEHHKQSTDEDHQNIADSDAEHQSRKIHFGFIEEWYIVNPAALLGIFIAYFLPRTKFPHAAHVLISTWASSSYLLMNMESQITFTVGIGIFAIIFIAVWLPCCISDIVFPLLFVESDLELKVICPDHSQHSHPHTMKGAEVPDENEN